ncbi:MAG: hypothetical protein AABX70_04755 [Nanoarchaeota archaeon]
MNSLMKPAFIILSQSAKLAAQMNTTTVKRIEEEKRAGLTGDLPLQERAQAFLQTKVIPKPMPGSLLAKLDKRLELIELSGEVARLELLLKELNNNGRYSSFELRNLSSKIEWLKSNVKGRMA